MTDAAEEKGFYESKGYARHMLILPVAHKEKLKRLAKHFGITQGEALEVMLDHLDLTRMGGHFEAKRQAKKSRSGPTTKTDLIKKMKDLSAEQISAIEAILDKQAATNN